MYAGTPKTLDHSTVPRRRTTHRRAAHAHPTARNLGRRSLDAHRQWLLEQHGPVCAYCGTVTPVDAITLDHVRPRRGQKAYDRADNLVLACAVCNAAKADTPFLSFLMAKRSRGVFLLHYGDHLSEPIKELARRASERSMLAAEDGAAPARVVGMRHRPGRGTRR
jgi:5-methylcytosine-specific restriction endonuclease McrA